MIGLGFALVLSGVINWLLFGLRFVLPTHTYHWGFWTTLAGDLLGLLGLLGCALLTLARRRAMIARSQQAS